MHCNIIQYNKSRCRSFVWGRAGLLVHSRAGFRVELLWWLMMLAWAERTGRVSNKVLRRFRLPCRWNSKNSPLLPSRLYTWRRASNLRLPPHKVLQIEAWRGASKAVYCAHSITCFQTTETASPTAAVSVHSMLLTVVRKGIALMVTVVLMKTDNDERLPY